MEIHTKNVLGSGLLATLHHFVARSRQIRDSDTLKTLAERTIKEKGDE